VYYKNLFTIRGTLLGHKFAKFIKLIGSAVHVPSTYDCGQNIYWGIPY